MEPITEEEQRLISQLRKQTVDLSMPQEFFEDKSLIRWIRARNHKLVDAETMLRNHVAWRSEFNVDAVADMDIFLSSEHSNLFEINLYGFDDDGGAVHIVHGNTLNFEKAVKLGLHTNVNLLTINCMEVASRLHVKHSEGKDYIPRFVPIYDLSGFSTSQFASADAISFAMNLIRSLDTNYPECVRRLFIVNAPWLFQAVWKIVKAVLAERTTQRFVILGLDKNQQRTEISKILQLHQFPQKYGGDGEDSFKSLIELEEAYELCHNVTHATSKCK